MVKAPFYDKNGLKKGAWSPEEDEKLKAHIQKYGHWNWRELPKYAGLSRCGKSCRLRWMNYLRPNVKHGNFTKEEENIILRLHAQVGNRWSTIAAKLPGRTDNEIKNYWHTHMKKHPKKDKASTYETLNEQKCEAKRQTREMSKFNQTNKRAKVESVPRDALCYSILESSPLSPTESPGNDISSSYSDFMYGMGNDANMQVCEDSGEFWNEPYVTDNAIVQDNIPLDLSFVYDTSEDLLYQVIQELARC